MEPKLSCDVAPECTNILLNIPIKDRSCKVLLLEGKHRPSSLWRWSTLNRSREPYPHVRDFLSYVWTMRSFEILQYQMKFLSPVSDNERRFAVTSMANLLFIHDFSIYFSLKFKNQNFAIYNKEVKSPHIFVK